jgi:hypothetical protein
LTAQKVRSSGHATVRAISRTAAALPAGLSPQVTQPYLCRSLLFLPLCACQRTTQVTVFSEVSCLTSLLRAVPEN